MTAFLGSSSRGANVATVVLTGVLAVLVWRTFLQPLRGQVAASTERLAAIEDEIARARGALARRQALEQEIARLEARVGAMRGHGDLGSLVGLQEAAADAGLAITRFEPRDPVQALDHIERTIALGLSGRFDAIGHFFDRLAAADTLLSVDELEIRRSGRPGTALLLDVACLVTVFVPDAWPRAAAVEPTNATPLVEPRFTRAAGDPFLGPGPASAPDAGPVFVSRRPGLAGVPIADVRVRGLVRGRNMSLAVLEALDGRSYVARVGTRLLDGSITAISSAVVFRRDEGASAEREVRKAVESTARTLAGPAPAQEPAVAHAEVLQ